MYGFTPYTLDEEFQKFEAVYIFTKRVTTKEGKRYKRLYVGETNNLATVIKDHENSLCLKQHGVDSICVHHDSNKTARRQKVRDIINEPGGRPPCNKLWQDQAIVDALQRILEGYPYLEYDEAETKRPLTTDERVDMRIKIDKRVDMLKIKITDLDKESADVGYEIASELREATDRTLEYIPSNSRLKKKHIRIVEFPYHDP